MALPRLVAIDRALSDAVDALRFAEPVTHVYNPLAYARRPHELYLRRYGSGPKEALFLGMNPGPFGMAQTGIPFGEIEHARDWLGVEAPVDKPAVEHPKRPIEGFACKRSEVSGRRLWSWAKTRFETPERFFERFFVVNYCPLVFMEGATGKNRVPEKLPPDERDPLFAACDAALRDVVRHLKPKMVIGVGTWAESRARWALDGFDVKFGTVLHPSPASPAANRGWEPQAEAQLKALGIALP
ncbi:MAG: single-stranded DNA-binding protein [Sandaracinus sp.]|nr:single-stranded DNA-binding protein [Sandaracinus sp.]MCB9631092.1 single-stranded DNA-binding protein [Sandaracinus sp.]